MDIASLGVEVTAKGIPETTKSLDGLSGAAARAEQTLETLAPNASKAAAAATQVGGSAGAASRQILQMGNAMSRVNGMSRTMNANVGNLAAQFQDIAVTSAMGMSALQIALQQGTQISAAFGGMGAGGAVRALGAAFMSVISPVSLVTIGLVAAGAAAIQYFFGINNASDQTEDNLRRQSGLIDDLGKKWADSIPALNAYIEAKKAADSAAENASAVQVITSQQWEVASAAVSDFGANINNVLEKMRQFGATDTQISDVQQAFMDVAAAVSDQNLKADQLVSLQNSVNAAFANTAANGVPAYKKALDGLTSSLNAVLGLNAALTKQAQFEQNWKNSTLPTLDPLGFINPDRDQTDRANGTKSQTQLAAEAAARAAGKGSKQSDYANALRAVQDQTAALKAQTAAQAGLNPLVSDYGYALTMAKTSADLLAAAERDKKAITPELTAQIHAQADALALATVAENKRAEAVTNAKASMETAKSAATGFLSTLRQGLVSGEGWWKSFGNAALSVLDKIASAIETQLVNALFSTSGGGFNLMSLFGIGSSVAAGGLSGSNVGATGAAGAAAPVAKMAARMPIAKQAVSAKGAGVHVTAEVSVNENGNWEARVTNIADKSADRMGRAVQATHKAWMKNGLHGEIESHLKKRRHIG